MPDGNGYHLLSMTIGLTGGERPRSWRVRALVTERMDEAADKRDLVRVEDIRFAGYEPRSPIGKDGMPIYTNGERIARYTAHYQSPADAAKV